MAGLGGDGAIDGGGVGAPFGVPFYEAAAAKDLELARYWVDKYQAISGRLIAPDYSGRFASPISQLKAAMDLLDQPGGPVRSPLLEVTDAATLTAIADILREAELPVFHERVDRVVAERSAA
jgi:4-hydroxy-tetrahydrodipicolinate synthase